MTSRPSEEKGSVRVVSIVSIVSLCQWARTRDGATAVGTCSLPAGVSSSISFSPARPAQRLAGAHLDLLVAGRRARALAAGVSGERRPNWAVHHFNADDGVACHRGSQRSVPLRAGGGGGPPPPRPLCASQFIMVVVNISVIIGFSFVPYIDWAAHIFGLISGEPHSMPARS